MKHDVNMMDSTRWSLEPWYSVCNQPHFILMTDPAQNNPQFTASSISGLRDYEESDWSVICIPPQHGRTRLLSQRLCRESWSLPSPRLLQWTSNSIPQVLIQDVPMLLVLSVVRLTLTSLQNFSSGRRSRPVICTIGDAEYSDMEFADELLSRLLRSAFVPFSLAAHMCTSSELDINSYQRISTHI